MTQWDEIEIAEFKRTMFNRSTPASKKTTTTDNMPPRKHNHFPQGKPGYAPRSCSCPVNIKIAKRG